MIRVEIITFLMKVMRLTIRTDVDTEDGTIYLKTFVTPKSKGDGMFTYKAGGEIVNSTSDNELSV